MSENTRNTTLTVQGIQALAKCQTGKELHFTRVAMGDGVIDGDTNIKEMTALVSERLDLPIVSNKVTGTGTTILETQLKNSTVTQGFFARELGIFIYDPDTLEKTTDGNGNITYSGTEILYAIRNTGDYSEFIPAGGAGETINLLYDVVTVVSQASSISVTLAEGVGEISRSEFTEHVDSDNPHPGQPHLSGTLTDADSILVKNSESQNFASMSLTDARKLLMGGEVSSLGNLTKRTAQLEIELSNLALSMVAAGDVPNSNLLIAEDFADPDMVDQFRVKVTSMAAGDDSLDIESDKGIIAGSHYWITDGINQEYIKVKSVIKNGSIYRVLASEPLAKTYDLATCYIYRTTALVISGLAEGAGDQKGFAWQPERVWKGTGANITVNVPLETTQSNADNFDAKGIEYTSSGMLSLSIK